MSSNKFSPDLLAGIVLAVLGVLLIVGALSLEIILGVALLVAGIFAITRNL